LLKLSKFCCVNSDMKHTDSKQYPESHTRLYSYHYIIKASKPVPQNP
jgi:hypothetical protein